MSSPACCFELVSGKYKANLKCVLFSLVWSGQGCKGNTAISGTWMHQSRGTTCLMVVAKSAAVVTTTQTGFQVLNVRFTLRFRELTSANLFLPFFWKQKGATPGAAHNTCSESNRKLQPRLISAVMHTASHKGMKMWWDGFLCLEKRLSIVGVNKEKGGGGNTKKQEDGSNVLHAPRTSQRIGT